MIYICKYKLNLDNYIQNRIIVACIFEKKDQKVEVTKSVITYKWLHKNIAGAAQVISEIGKALYGYFRA